MVNLTFKGLLKIRTENEIPNRGYDAIPALCQGRWAVKVGAESSLVRRRVVWRPHSNLPVSEGALHQELE